MVYLCFCCLNVSPRFLFALVMLIDLLLVITNIISSVIHLANPKKATHAIISIAIDCLLAAITVMSCTTYFARRTFYTNFHKYYFMGKLIPLTMLLIVTALAFFFTFTSFPFVMFLFYWNYCLYKEVRAGLYAGQGIGGMQPAVYVQQGYPAQQEMVYAPQMVQPTIYDPILVTRGSMLPANEAPIFTNFQGELSQQQFSFGQNPHN